MALIVVAADLGSASVGLPDVRWKEFGRSAVFFT